MVKIFYGVRNMKLTSILQSGKLSLSFEVFPPKTDSAFESVEKAIDQIAAATKITFAED